MHSSFPFTCMVRLHRMGEILFFCLWSSFLPPFQFACLFDWLEFYVCAIGNKSDNCPWQYARSNGNGWIFHFFLLTWDISYRRTRLCRSFWATELISRRLPHSRRLLCSIFPIGQSILIKLERNRNPPACENISINIYRSKASTTRKKSYIWVFLLEFFCTAKHIFAPVESFLGIKPVSAHHRTGIGRGCDCTPQRPQK